MNEKSAPTPAAVYARVSSDRQDVDLSVAAQLRALRDYAERNGFIIVRQYVDEAESGRVADRPQFRRMIDEGSRATSPFETILVWKFSRFTRKREHAVAFKSMLRKKGIRVVSITMFLGIAPASIGRIGGGVRRVTGRIDVAMIQSLVRKDEVAELVTRYGHVVVDECHHIPAVSFERVISEVRARYVAGLTATPKRRDGQHPIIEMQLGPARYVADRKRRSYARTFSHRLTVRETDFQVPDPEVRHPIQDIYRSLADDESRNALILADIIGSLRAGRSPIVLTERRDHLDFLAERLRGQVRHLVVLRGGASAKRRREVTAELAAIPDDEERLLLAVGRYVGEGFDDARLDTLFLTMPVSWRGTLVQYTGRLHRSHPSKADVRIYDYVDVHVPVLARMFKRRLAGYRSLGYEPEYEQTATLAGEESNTDRRSHRAGAGSCARSDVGRTALTLMQD